MDAAAAYPVQHNVLTYLLSLYSSAMINQLLPTGNPREKAYCDDAETLLHLVCREGNVNAVVSLLARGASTEIQGCRVGTALHIAAAHGRVEVMELLLERGADIEARDSSGNTPLQVAVAWDALEAVKLLLGRGADLTATSCFGDDVFSIAITRCAKNALKYLCDRDASMMFSSRCCATVTLLPPPPPLLILAAFVNRNREMALLFERLVGRTDCPPRLRVDASLVAASSTVFSSRAVKKFKQALKMKQELLLGGCAQTDAPGDLGYGGQQEVSSVEEWDKLRPRRRDYYLQSCIILERCVGSDHPLLYQHLSWYVFTSGYMVESDFTSELYQKLLSMFVTREELKLKHCDKERFDFRELISITEKAEAISLSPAESIGLVLKGLEVFAKSREKHETCEFFRRDPTPSNDPVVRIVHQTLNHFLGWISTANLCQTEASGDRESRALLTGFRDLLNRFVSLSHSVLQSRGVLNVTWPKVSFKGEKSREALLFLLSALLETEAVSRINMADPITGVRPLHHFLDVLGKKAAVLLLSHGAHLDVASRNHLTLVPGRFPASSLVDGSSPTTDCQLSSPLPLLCQCSHAVLKEKIRYHQLNLPPRIKDYIALHYTSPYATSKSFHNHHHNT